MQQRVDHADDELGAVRHVASELREVRADRLDLLAVAVRLELGEQLGIEVDRRDLEAKPRKWDRLEAAARAEIDSALRCSRRKAARREKFRVARELSVPAAVHPRIDVG